MKEWTVEIYIIDQDGKEKPAKCFTKAVYHLHPSFENPDQSMWTDSSGGTWLTVNSFHGTPVQVHQRGMG
jgi:hypothetical protein